MYEFISRYRLIEEEKQKLLNAAEEAKAASEAENMFILLDSNGDGKLTKDEIKTRQTFDKNKDGEVSDDEALFFLNMEEEMSKEDFLTTGWMMAKPFFLMDQGMFQPPIEDQEEEQEPSLMSGGQPITVTEAPLKELTEEEIQAQGDHVSYNAAGEKEIIPGVVEEQEEEEELYEEDGPASVEDVKVEESKYDEATQQLIDGDLN